jgi:hypothetical protein
MLFSFNYSQNNIKFIINELNRKYKINGTYFLVQMHSGIEAFTNAAALVRRLEEIKKFQSCKNIVYLVKDDGELGDNLYYYLNKNFYIDTSRNQKIIVDDKLFDKLGYATNSSIYFIKNNTFIKKIDGKYENLLHDLGTDILNISMTKLEVKGWENTPPFIRNIANLLYPFNDTLCIEMADTQEDRIRLVDKRNGKVLKILPLYDILDYKSVYFNKFKNPLGISNDYFDRKDSILRHIKRTPLRIENIQYESDDEIYLLGDFNVYYPSKYNFYIPSDFNKTIKVNKGSSTNVSVATIFKLNFGLKIVDTLFLFSAIDTSDKAFRYFIQYTSAFKKVGDEFFFPGYNFDCFKDSTYDLLYKNNVSYKFIYAFKKDDNNILRFDKVMPPVSKHPLEKIMFNEKHFFFKNHDDKIFILNGIFPDIYEIHQEQPVGVIENYEKFYKKYKLFSFNNYKYNSNDFNENIPFYVFSSFKYFNGKILGLFYILENKPIVAFYNPEFKLLAKYDLSAYIPKEHFLLMKKMELYPFLDSGGLSYLILKKGKADFHQIKFSFSDINLNCKTFTGRFE